MTYLFRDKSYFLRVTMWIDNLPLVGRSTPFYGVAQYFEVPPNLRSSTDYSKVPV
jgi:hypothetical protein